MNTYRVKFIKTNLGAKFLQLREVWAVVLTILEFLYVLKFKKRNKNGNNKWLNRVLGNGSSYTIRKTVINLCFSYKMFANMVHPPLWDFGSEWKTESIIQDGIQCKKNRNYVSPFCLILLHACKAQNINYSSMQGIQLLRWVFWVLWPTYILHAWIANLLIC